MSPVLVVLVVAAVGLVAFGIQVSARQIQHVPVDSRSPGSLIETSRSHRFTVRPSELEHLRSLVTESLASEAVAVAKLRPLLARLEAEAPNPRRPVAALESARRRPQMHWLEQELAELEQQWDLGPTT